MIPFLEFKVSTMFLSRGQTFVMRAWLILCATAGCASVFLWAAAPFGQLSPSPPPECSHVLCCEAAAPLQGKQTSVTQPAHAFAASAAHVLFTLHSLGCRIWMDFYYRRRTQKCLSVSKSKGWKGGNVRISMTNARILHFHTMRALCQWRTNHDSNGSNRKQSNSPKLTHWPNIVPLIDPPPHQYLLFLSEFGDSSLTFWPPTKTLHIPDFWVLYPTLALSFLTLTPTVFPSLSSFFYSLFLSRWKWKWI